MPTKDIIHEAVKQALVKDGWTITADPYTIEYKEITVFADMAAERLLGAERGEQKIVVEVKSFLGRSPVHDLELAIGQYNVYLSLLEVTEPERRLYLAISEQVNNELFTQEAVQLITHRNHLALIVVNLQAKEIVQWIAESNTDI